MTSYHENAVCGSCGGKLESHRDAVCETCVPESNYYQGEQTMVLSEAEHVALWQFRQAYELAAAERAEVKRICQAEQDSDGACEHTLELSLRILQALKSTSVEGGA